MAITWDAPLTAAVAAALARRLGVAGGRRRGARLRALHLDHEAQSLLLWFREATLLFRLHPAGGAALLLDPTEPLETARRLAATLESVEVPPDDRVLLLTVRKIRGGRERFTVAVELVTNQWNAVVAEGEERRVRHVLREREGERPLAVGSLYEPPPPSRREGASGDLDWERWLEILSGVEPPRRRGVLLSTVAWTSSLNARALLGESGTDDGQEGRRALERGWKLWRRVAGVATGREAAEPVIFRTEGILQPYPLPLPGVECEAVGDVLDALRTAAEEGDGGVVAAVPSAWIRAIEKRIRGSRGKIHGLERELEKAPDPDAARGLGDLLLARYGDVPRGRKRVELEDFEGRRVEVELDPALSPQENAARYYDEATRAERARERIPTLIEEAREEASRLEALLARVQSGEATAAEVEAELPERSALSGPADATPSLPYRRYRSSGGLEIRVGRGSKRNDELTFRHSRPDDVWLHARHAAGAHVILRWDADGAPPARDLAEAAALAAWHSKARTSGSVPVDWTRRKYVRSPRGAPPGRVVPDRVRTVFVEPDEAVERRLRDE
jgi:predicted ribosome quality control (RQC) complex YloA/Tae2 family protein